MAKSQKKIKSQTMQLSTEAFEAFCKDISGMFNVDMECKKQEDTVETVESLKKKFKKLAAVNSIKSEGALGGNFQIVFDKKGLRRYTGRRITGLEVNWSLFADVRLQLFDLVLQPLQKRVETRPIGFRCCIIGTTCV